MKLLNHTLKYLAISFPVFIGAWAALFYFNVVDEIEDSLDDGLENIKMLIIQQSSFDPQILDHNQFRERNYAIQLISEEQALLQTDRYVDTLMYMINEEDYEPVRKLVSAFKADNGQYYEVQVISSTLEKDDLLEDILISILWLYAILLITALVINNWVLRRIWKPFYQILDKMRLFNLERNPEILPTNSRVQEFVELDIRLRKLVDQSYATFLNQKHFLENASHEIQTPLAISINKLELLLEQGELSDNDYPKLVQILRNLQRLSRLNKTLLLLNRIENRQYSAYEDVDALGLTRQLVADFQDLAQARNKRLELHLNASTCVWTMNRDLAAILLTNLIKNALIHSPSDTTIEVEVHHDGISVKNTGEEALNGEVIFERFNKPETTTHGNGLGLSIAKAIAEVSGLYLHYQYLDGKHVFSVKSN